MYSETECCFMAHHPVVTPYIYLQIHFEVSSLSDTNLFIHFGSSKFTYSLLFLKNKYSWFSCYIYRRKLIFRSFDFLHKSKLSYGWFSIFLSTSLTINLQKVKFIECSLGVKAVLCHHKMFQFPHLISEMLIHTNKWFSDFVFYFIWLLSMLLYLTHGWIL